MKNSILTIAHFTLLLLGAQFVSANEESDEMAGLQKIAAEFATAYNKKDAAAIAALFTENGELSDLNGKDLASGREDIKTRYEEIFSDESSSIALEVTSVRIVAPNLAIEDGTAHFTPIEDEDAPPKSMTYTAVLLKSAEGVWQIASTRDLNDTTSAAGQLSFLAEAIKGEWTCRNAEGVKIDFAFGWDKTGEFLTGEILTTTADSTPQEGNIRIGWDAAKKAIVSWIFDAKGGATTGTWTATDEGWLIRAEGTTADGETLTANQKLTTDGENALIWATTHRVIDGEAQPDGILRIVRQAPDPDSNENPEEDAAEDAKSEN